MRLARPRARSGRSRRAADRTTFDFHPEGAFLDQPVEGEFFAYFVTPDGKFVDVRDRIRDVPDDVFAGYTVEDIMSPVPVTIAPDAPLQELARSLRDRKVHRILVVEEERLVGIVTTMDILNALAEG